MRRAVHKKLTQIDEQHENRERPLRETRMSRMDFEADQYRSVAFLSKGLSDENRLRILLCLSSAKKSVSGIAEELGLSQPLVSHHLKELKRCLMVTVERDGPFIYYGLTDSRILDAIRLLDSMAADFIAARKTI